MKMETKILPKISVVIATYNSSRTLEDCLKSLRNQKYPKKLVEIVLADGGSKDKTKEIGKKYKAKIVDVPREKQNAEFNKGYGLQYAKNEYILMIDHDNIIPHSEWLKRMIEPHLENKNIVATEPIRYKYKQSLSLLDRYFALFGVNDPVPYYLGKADRLDYITNKYNLKGNAKDLNKYYLVDFDKNNPKSIPTLGANGFLIKKKYFLKSYHEPDKYFHIDINVDLVKQGYTTYAFIKDDIIHLTNSRFLNFLKRRILYMNQYYMNNFSVRRYSVFYPEDGPRLILFIIYSLTLIKPLYDSFKGWLKIKDIAWFIHPFMCLSMLFIYGTTMIKGSLRKLFS